MTLLFQFFDAHYFLAFCMMYFAYNLIAWPMRLINRCIRHKNIIAAGWPPEHLDADGDRRVELN